MKERVRRPGLLLRLSLRCLVMTKGAIEEKRRRQLLPKLRYLHHLQYLRQGWAAELVEQWGASWVEQTLRVNRKQKVVQTPASPP